ncbi:hypothetical protein C7M71_025940 [Peterkaempfera bronchialis]|uniref:Uncharacterized protein n=1 Tax=Peterkaempfera bronchialis TaxID=2126346 RepID=A0A345T2X4_9ACTN|nr:hypothetical protein C7M71_025940 [Peterkaempfera bronchialis]
MLSRYALCQVLDQWPGRATHVRWCGEVRVLTVGDAGAADAAVAEVNAIPPASTLEAAPTARSRTSLLVRIM